MYIQQRLRSACVSMQFYQNIHLQHKGAVNLHWFTIHRAEWLIRLCWCADWLWVFLATCKALFWLEWWYFFIAPPSVNTGWVLSVTLHMHSSYGLVFPNWNLFLSVNYKKASGSHLEILFHLDILFVIASSPRPLGRFCIVIWLVYFPWGLMPKWKWFWFVDQND